MRDRDLPRNHPLLVKAVWADFCQKIRQHRAIAHSSWRWHIDEVFAKINGERFYLWCAIDHKSAVFESYVSKRCDCRAALKMLKKLLSRQSSPHEVVTDKLGSYGAAMQVLNLKERHEIDQYRNNQIENSHLYFRRRERAMCRFRSMAALQKFTSARAAIFNHFSHQRYLLRRLHFKDLRDQSIADWREICAA